jgi:hypothetical protein
MKTSRTGKSATPWARKKKRSLVETPFCGMWADREDVTDGPAFARHLRKKLETRGDHRDPDGHG